MGREIKGFIIGALVSGGIHLAIFFTPIYPTPHLDVKEIPGSIEISLGVQQQTPGERTSTQEKETTPPRQKIDATMGQPSPQAEGRAKTTEGEDNTLGESNPDRRGDSALAVPRQEGNPKPPYPEVARRRGYEGTVRLKVEVLASGEVGRIWIEESSGYEALDRSALKTVKDWHFIPARFGGISVKSTVIIPVTFQLKD
jgi:TonB family protein